MPNICGMYKDPEISVKDALALYRGNQSKLATALGINRAAISEWKKTKREFIPPLQAYRLQQMHPDRFGIAAA